MAASRCLSTVLTDVVTCPICLELFDSPKSLPCLHTFCLVCIEGHCRNSKPGNEVACPVCRQTFSIPACGVRGLVSNFFILGLVEAKKFSANDAASHMSGPCEVCLAESGLDRRDVGVSTMYCVDCNQKLCEQCSRPHRRMKGGPHKVVPVVPTGSEVVSKSTHKQSGQCDKHQHEYVNRFCFDCKTNICELCFADEHRRHQCKDVDTVAAECIRQIDGEMQMVRKVADVARDCIRRTDDEKQKFLANMEGIGANIVSRGDELKQLIDKQVNELTQEVISLKNRTSKEIESYREDIDVKLLAFETFVAYCSELKANGKPCDITRAANDLHIRATELLQRNATGKDYSTPAVVFKTTSFDEQLPGGQNLIGCIQTGINVPGSGQQSSVTREACKTEKGQHRWSESQLAKAKLEKSGNVMKLEKLEKRENSQLLKDASETEMHKTVTQVTGTGELTKDTNDGITEMLPDGKGILGVTSLNGELCVLRYGSKDQVEVYSGTPSAVTSSAPGSLLRQLSVPGQSWDCGLADITSCEHHSCLYIADCLGKCVYKVEMNGKIAKWSLNYQAHGLSVTPAFTVLVACREVRKLLELGPDGKQLREINLQRDIVHPQHAIQLSNGQFVICHGQSEDSVNRVCIVDTNGHVTQSYGGRQGSAIAGQLNVPHHLAVDKDGIIFVADRDNRRVLLLSPTLGFVGSRKIVSSDQLKWKPRRLYLDADRGRLFVVHGKLYTGRVFVLQL